MHVFRETPSNVYEVDLSRNDVGVLSLRDALIFLELATLSDLSVSKNKVRWIDNCFIVFYWFSTVLNKRISNSVANIM